MASRSQLLCLQLAFLLLSLNATTGFSQLSPDFYSECCPQALPTIKRVVEAAIYKQRRVGAFLLRMHFHDCFVNGCDASVLLDPTPTIDSETLHFSLPKLPLTIPKPSVHSITNFSPSFPRFLSSKVVPRHSSNHISCNSASTFPVSTKNYEFSDASSEVELRLQLGAYDIQSPRDIFVDANGTSLTIRVQHHGSPVTLIETNQLFENIKPAETIWYIDEDQLVINLKKQDPDLKWPDIVESWESLTVGSMQLLQGTSIYIIGDSTEINQKVAQELAVGLGYTPLSTKELLETYAKQSIDSWVLTEGSDSVAEAESSILESLSSHVRAVVATLGGQQGAARRADKWQHLYAGFTVWLSTTEATDEDSAKEEARRQFLDALAYSKAEVVVKLQGWDADLTKSVAQASLSALKQLVLSDKKLPGKKSLYIRLGCRGDWPNIKPPGWDPSAGDDLPQRAL